MIRLALMIRFTVRYQEIYRDCKQKTTAENSHT